MYVLYSFTYDKFGYAKGASSFQTKKEAENAQKNMIETANKNGNVIKTVIELNKNELANKIKNMAPSAAIYYFHEIISEIEKLQNEINELKSELKIRK